MISSSEANRFGTRFNFVFGVYSPKVKGRPTVKKFGAYYHPILGFDVARFDEDIKTPDGVSTRSRVEKHWGLEAVTLIEELIGAKS